MKRISAALKPVEASATILVVSDKSDDAELVKTLLAPEYGQVFLSIDPDWAVKDFESRAHDVLVLAFDALEKSERYYLGLNRLSSKVHLQPHRTIILCNKYEVSRAYQACRKEYFDDYILFWPMTNDAPRLLMSVYHAIRGLAAVKENLPSSAQFAAQARNLSEMGSMMDQQIAQGSQRIEVVNRAMGRAEQEIGAALDGFSSKLMQGALQDMSNIQNVVLAQEIKRLKQDEIQQRFRTVAESVQAIKQWVDQFKEECAPHIESACALSAMADSIPQTVLVVDDDAFQRQITNELLATENYRLVFAAGGVEALNILRKMQPDLILMDIQMPDLNGIETTRRLRAMPQFANVPVIMVSGKRDEAAVRDSMKIGATDFVVKPYDRDTLTAKMARALNP